ncbi:putative aldolase class 2 protein PA3430 [Symsagittifera roscoffensis]|uniref:putative aldolase class 2 protein PA3430 n=1 Tax=Symsagittifera roscoffensis TaxID=84072 RepID=UPI00307C1C2B
MELSIRYLQKSKGCVMNFRTLCNVPSRLNSTNKVLKICDFEENARSFRSISTAEKIARCKLASLYRLLYISGWAEDVLNHVTLRLPSKTAISCNNDNQIDETFLINKFGLQYWEVTSSNLVEATLSDDAEIVSPGSNCGPVGLNKAGVVLHTALHRAREDVECIVHFHQTDVQALSALKCGLLKTSLESCILGGVSRHSFRGITIHQEERKQLRQSLGKTNKVMMLDNHGAVVCGSSVEETWQLTTLLVHAAKSQLTALQAVGGDESKLVLIEEETAQRTYETAWSGNLHGRDLTDTVSHSGEKGKSIAGEGIENEALTQKFGVRLFNSEIRRLDFMGYNTGLT